MSWTTQTDSFSTVKVNLPHLHVLLRGIGTLNVFVHYKIFPELSTIFTSSHSWNEENASAIRGHQKGKMMSKMLKISKIPEQWCVGQSQRWSI